MRVVDHVLVEHGIGIAENESWQLLKLFINFQIIFVKLFTGCWEEHSINLGSTFNLWLDPDMLTIECLAKHLTHLFILTKQ